MAANVYVLKTVHSNSCTTWTVRNNSPIKFFSIIKTLNISIQKLTMAQKVCVIFGFGPGIGAACARRWINEGFKVAIIARYY